MAAIALVPVFAWLGVSAQELWFAVLLAVFIVAMHHSNIVNMLNGTEYKFQRIRIVNWFR